MTITEQIRTPRPKKIVYPDADGKPMAESDIHRVEATQTIDGFKIFFRHRNDVYVSGNNFIYYEEGNPKKCVSPDAYVVFGVSSKLRDSYKVWEEDGHSPDVVFEFTSRKTRREDDRIKYPLYEKVLKVKEYFRFDPEGDYLKPRLQGFRLNAGVYEPIEMLNGRLYSDVLGLELVMDGENLRLFDPRRRQYLPTIEEVTDRAIHEAAARRRAEERANNEAMERQAAEERADSEAMERQAAEERANNEAMERQAAEERAGREAHARRLAEEELQRMREELEALRRSRH